MTKARRLAMVAVLGLMLLTAGSALAAPGDITTYVDPAGNVAEPLGITAGPDGALWFTSGNNNRIGRITVGGVITTFADPAGTIDRPDGITASPDGNLWFTSQNNNRIGRITPAGAIATFGDPAGNVRGPRGITAGPGTQVWFTSTFSDRIGRIDTQFARPRFSRRRSHSCPRLRPCPSPAFPVSPADRERRSARLGAPVSRCATLGRRAERGSAARRLDMATFGIVHRFSGGTREQYEASLKAVHPDGGAGLPEGQLLHLAGPSDGDWVVVAVHQSKESWERFRDDILLPGLASVEGGLPGPPEETTFDVTNFQTAHRPS